MSTITPWTLLSREQIFKKYSHQIDKFVYELPDGSQGDFYLRVEGPCVCMLPLTPDNQVILVRQYRPGPDKIILELPGGFADSGEDHLVAAQREFREETGYTGEFEFVGQCLEDAYSTMIRYCYVVKNCRLVGKPPETRTEHTELVLLSLDVFRNHLRSGQLTDVEVGYLCLDHLGLLG